MHIWTNLPYTKKSGLYCVYICTFVMSNMCLHAPDNKLHSAIASCIKHNAPPNWRSYYLLPHPSFL